MTPGYINYTFKMADGTEKRLVNINVAEARAIQKETGLSQRDTMIEWSYRNGLLTDEEYAALGINVGQQAPSKPKRKAPARKVDVDKKIIITSLFEYLSSGQVDDALDRKIDSVVIENDQRLIRFTIGEQVYDLTLARKRAPKA